MAALNASAQKIFNQNFNSFEPDSYWHNVMKSQDPERLPLAIAFDRGLPPSQQPKPEFYEQRSICSWTPLHVAAIQGNKAGIEFLCKKGVSLTAKDDFGCTPVDYCHPQLLSSMGLKLTPTELISTIMHLFLEKWHVTLSPKDTCYHAGSHDFGVQIQELLISDSPIPTSSSESGYKGDFYIINLKRIAKGLGFDVKVAQMEYMIRDFWIPLSEGKFGVPACSKNVKVAIQRADSLFLSLQNKSTFCATHEYFSGGIGGVNVNFLANKSDFEPVLKDLVPLPFYLEGGNHYQVFLHGKKKVVLGADCLYTILNQFRLDKRFEEASFNPAIKQIEDNLTLEEIKQVLPEMYSQGLLAKTKGCSKGFISCQELSSILTELLHSHIFNGQDIPPGAYLKEAQKQNLFSPLDLNEQQIHASRHIVARYLAQISEVKLCIAKTFEISVDDLIFIDQVDYHLDVFMRPGPDESFFVQDYRCTYELLELIESQASGLLLTSNDLEILKRYKQTAQTLDRQLKPLLESTHEKLKAAGFTVIPMPGIFYDATPLSINPLIPSAVTTYNVNFINAITGYSAKTGRYYYIAGGAETGGRLGKILMDAYREILRSYEISLYFVGENPNKPGNFLESKSWLNVLGHQAGIHCFSTEVKTASYSPQT